MLSSFSKDGSFFIGVVKTKFWRVFTVGRFSKFLKKLSKPCILAEVNAAKMIKIYDV